MPFDWFIHASGLGALVLNVVALVHTCERRLRVHSSLAGIAWALLQPWRLTLLHPYDQGFWWLLVEPPLLVVAAGVLFHAFVARPLVHDLEDVR